MPSVRDVLETQARAASERGNCLRAKVGAVLTSYGGTLLGVGANRAPEGHHSCEDLGECEMFEGHCVRTVHAEINAIIRAFDTGHSHLLRGGKMYIWGYPLCPRCKPILQQLGIEWEEFTPEARAWSER